LITFTGRGILLDIEGTTSSIQFVYDVLFPYARRELDGFLARNWSSPGVVAACEQIARDAGEGSLSEWCNRRGVQDPQQLVKEEVIRLMNGDAKTGGLKLLQGLMWRGAYESGELKSHVFDDVPPAMARWAARDLDLRIYSSGSVLAQKLLFAHTTHGDLTPYLRGYYDTTAGPKKEAGSYQRILHGFRLQPREVLFLSDAPGELEAAAKAGLQVTLVRRPGNAVVGATPFPDIEQFSDIMIETDRGAA
jgi:enolase-phosphatase E1